MVPLPEKAPLLPFATVTLELSKPVTDSEKVNVKVTASPILASPEILSEMVTVGAVVSKAWVYCAGAVACALLAVLATPVFTRSTVIFPDDNDVGVTANVYTVVLTAVNAPLVQLPMVMLLAVKPVTASENVNVKVTMSPLLAVPLMLSVMTTVGGVALLCT